MPKQTVNLKMGYLAKGEPLDEITESRRFNTIDAQLRGLFEVMGDGVIDGWAMSISPKGTTYLDISPGTGIVGGVASASTSITTIGPVVSNTTMYVIANLKASTYWTRSIDIVLSLTSTTNANQILLGSVLSDVDGNISLIDTTNRRQVGIVEAIKEYVKNHRHVGGTDNPEQIDLASEVQGQINQANLPELDAGIITTGKINPKQVSNIDHSTQLTSTGMLTHAQLDTFVEQVRNSESSSLGEIAIANFLQLVLALKHQWPEVDEYLVNLIAFIPGISPDSFIDTANTTAIVDTRPSIDGGQHTITGTVGPSFSTNTKTWKTSADFSESATFNVSPEYDVLRLATTETSASLESFEDITGWTASVSVIGGGANNAFSADGSVVYSGQYSGRLDYSPGQNANLSLVLEKIFDPQDWSGYNTVSFFINVDSIEHGDLFFYLKDADAGIQNSYTMILPRNQFSINRDTLMNGWREVWIDISKFTRTAISSMGIITSTDKGWDASKALVMNIDNMILSSGSAFSGSGYARFVYGTGAPSNFSMIRTDSMIPSGCAIRIRTRLANDISEFINNTSGWSSYNYGDFSVYNPTAALWKYIEIEVLLTSSIPTESPILEAMHLDIETSSTIRTFSYDSQDDWKGGTLSGIDPDTGPGSISVSNTTDIGTYLYSSDNRLIQTDSSFTEILRLSGNTIPRSYRQALAGSSPEFGSIMAVKNAPGGTFLVCDSSNDRVVHVNSSGELITGFYGAFSSDPYDGYGTEDEGPGSNKDVAAAAAQPATAPTAKIKAVMSVFNPNNQTLYVAFDRDVQPVHLSSSLLKKDGFLLKFGAYRLYIGHSAEFSLLGIDPTNYNGWALTTTSSNQYMSQFTFLSRVLCIKLSASDSAVLSDISDYNLPRISISAPYTMDIYNIDSALVKISVSNFLMPDSGRIRYKVDSGAYSYTVANEFLLDGLSNGKHTVYIDLVDTNDLPLANEEASAEVSFLIDTMSSNTSAMVQIISPTQNQLMPSSFSLQIATKNHPIISSGSHIQYRLDAGSWVDTYYDSIPVSGISGGMHTVDVRAVDASGNEVSSPYSSASVKFFSGTSTIAGMKLLIDGGAVYGTDGNPLYAIADTIIDTDISNIYMENLFSPIDIQYLDELSSDDNSTGGSYLVAKGRSPSWSIDMGPPQTNNVTAASDAKLIFKSIYMSGHSVVEYSRSGNILFSNNAAKFFDVSSNVKKYAGSVQKISQNEVIMADAINSRAIVSTTSNNATKVVWEYVSDRIVSDFKIAGSRTKQITIEAGSISASKLSSKSGTTVTFINASPDPIVVLSGKTTPSLFEADPDLGLYGDMFRSPEIQSGQAWNFTFNQVGTFEWFSYPQILSGQIQITNTGVSTSDTFFIVERSPESPLFGGRVIQVDSWGNMLWSMGDGYLYDPVDVEPLLNGRILVSS